MIEALRQHIAKTVKQRPRKGLSRFAFWLVAWLLVLTALRLIPGIFGGLAAGLQITVLVTLIMVSIPPRLDLRSHPPPLEPAPTSSSSPMC